MKKRMMLFTGAVAAAGLLAVAAPEQKFPSDVFPTPKGDLRISLPGHAVVFFEFGGKTVWVDPVMPYVLVPDNPPKADVILITHEHGDHLNVEGIEAVRKSGTRVVCAPRCAAKLPWATVMKNGEKTTVDGIPVEALPAYNLAESYHPKGVGNGYVLTFGGLRVYVAGDTENVPEVKALRDIDIAVLPLMRPYTMSEEMLADAARAIKPKVLYIYHVRDADPAKLKGLLKDSGIDLRFRP